MSALSQESVSVSSPEPLWFPHQYKRFQHKYWLHGLLLGLTVVTTTFMGALWFAQPDTLLKTPLSLIHFLLRPSSLLAGLSFSLPTLTILLAHEMGHYLTCRYYQIDATLPYFIPAPVGIGTFGAFIRIKEPIPTKNQLFDIGAFGPLAGFLMTLPFAIIGLQYSTPYPVQAVGPYSLTLGDPLLFSLLVPLFHQLDHNTTLILHPFAMAAWVGCLATSLNLLPFGQLDGGHILYAVLGRKQRRLAFPLYICLIGLGFYWLGWLFWALLILFFGIAHPPTWDEIVPMDKKRLWLAGGILLVFLLTFMPAPVQ